MPRALQPFTIRDYRVLVSAMAISVFGFGLWAVAVVYQVRVLGGGPVQLSVVATANSIGLLGFVLLGGIVADRVSTRGIILAVEAVNLLVVGATAALALTGHLTLAQLAAAGLLLGAAGAFFFPAYSALLPRMLPEEHLLAANGVEGTMRPVLQQAAGPAAAGALVAALSPGHALAIMAACHLVALTVLTRLSRDPAYDAPARPVGDPGAGAPPRAVTHPVIGLVRAAIRDLVEGVAHTARTPWLKWTLLFAVVWVLVLIGPIEVLLPFVVSENLGGDARTFGLVLAAFGTGQAAGSLATASLPLPRRYLTWMLACWGFGALPIAAVGFIDSFWVMLLALSVVGATGGIGQVLWGTLLQRRVPRHMLGRISSLDFFVSLILMPVSMAAAGPLSHVFPMWAIFLVAGLVSPVIGVVAWLAARMYRDEIAHPLRDAGGSAG